MMSQKEQKDVAVLAWTFAVGLSIRSLPDGTERDSLEAARTTPNLITIRAVLAVGRYRPWRQLNEAAIDDILGAPK